LRKKNRNSIKVKGLLIAFLVSFTFSAVICPCACAASMWSKTYGGAAADTAAGETVQASDGGYAILGDTSSFGAGGSDFWLIKTDADGNMQWNKTYGGTGTETSGDMCLTSDDGYAMSGYTTSFGAGGQDFWLVKTDATGNMLWNKTYGGTGNEYAYHVEQTLDGGYALFGQTNSFGAGNNDFWLVKTDGSGNMQWNQTYGGTGNDIGIHVLQTGDGGYALAGGTTSFGAGSNDAWLIKTDAAGAMQWNMTYGGNMTEISYALLETSDGGYLLTINTSSFGAGGTDIWLVKTDELGVVPEGLTIGVMLLLSTVATIVGIRYLHKRPKWKRW
jgi:predicted secreted protein